MNLEGVTQSQLAGRKFFLTGHNGFKGSWLTLWLHRLKCEVTGYAIPTAGGPSIFSMGELKNLLTHEHISDIRSGMGLIEAMQKAKPELVIHMAAQSLVRRSYAMPEETWSTNVMGTVNVLEAVRKCPSVKAVLVVTTDKCYENREWSWGYRECDALGGYDPYSASKAGAELVVQSYRRSFFLKTGPLLASARAGNVVGGGDWNDDRLIPDIARSIAAEDFLIVRNPQATRPWQHVLDCLSGYLLLAGRLLQGDRECAAAFNFGPGVCSNVHVEEMLRMLQNYWPEFSWKVDEASNSSPVHEAKYLYLDSSLAYQRLNWRPKWELKTTLDKTATWYRTVLADQSKALQMTEQQLREYIES